MAPRTPLQLFSFGYWGWGNAARALVRSMDAVESARGFAAPLFVDTRISRSVRARDFNGNALERIVGAARYRWMPALGNAAIRDGGAMRIAEPEAAEVLLDVALEAQARPQRVVFFCACEVPGREGAAGCCHRTLVAGLLLDAARRRGVSGCVVEWPGGDPGEVLDVPLARNAFDKVRRGGRAIPLHDALPLARAAALPWFTPVCVRPEGEDRAPSWRLLCGPARYTRDAWWLPVLGHVEADPVAGMRAEIAQRREAGGYEPRAA